MSRCELSLCVCLTHKHTQSSFLPCRNLYFTEIPLPRFSNSLDVTRNGTNGTKSSCSGRKRGFPYTHSHLLLSTKIWKYSPSFQTTIECKTQNSLYYLILNGQDPGNPHIDKRSLLPARWRLTRAIDKVILDSDMGWQIVERIGLGPSFKPGEELRAERRCEVSC